MVNLDHMIVFVSYSSKNRKRIEDLVLQLGQLGHDVQFESKLIGGEVPWQQVFDSIATCDLFVATLSAETLVSYSSRIEHEYARDLNKYILFVALDELSSLADLDPQVRSNAVDFSETNPRANELLANALSSFDHLEPRLSTGVESPSWSPELEDLERRVHSKNGDAGEQAAILLNLREFLERHETFATARNLLTAFAARADLRPEIRSQSRRMLGQARHIGSLLQKIQRRGIFYAAIILSLLVSLAIVLLSQVVLQFRAQRGATVRLTSTALTLRAVTLTFTPVQTQLASATAFTSQATTVPSTQIDSSPEVTATEILPTSSDMAVTSVTNTPIVTSTPLSLITNTPRSVTGTAVALVIMTATKLPATVTPLPPTTTSTGIPKPTFTSVPTQVTQVSVLPTSTSVPQNGVSIVTPKGSPLNFEALITRKIYVGLGVEDSIFGVRVTGVSTTAKSAGVQVGDYILAVGAEVVKTSFEFLRVMQTQNPSSTVTLRTRRDNRIVEIPLAIGERDFALPYPS